MLRDEEKIIKDLTKYISFSSKRENFSNEEDYIFNLETSKRIQVLLDLYKEEKLKNKMIIFPKDYKPIGSKGRRFISEDKIKAKIEEYDKLQKEMTFKNHNADNINDCYKYGDKAQKAMYQKEVLQSLLEKEE